MSCCTQHRKECTCGAAWEAYREARDARDAYMDARDACPVHGG